MNAAEMFICSYQKDGCKVLFLHAIVMFRHQKSPKKSINKTEKQYIISKYRELQNNHMTKIVYTHVTRYQQFWSIGWLIDKSTQKKNDPNNNTGFKWNYNVFFSSNKYFV